MKEPAENISYYYETKFHAVEWEATAPSVLDISHV
jgi:hypothetical protein